MAMKRLLIFFLATVFVETGVGQSISLPECYQLANQNFPAFQKTALVDSISRLSERNAAKMHLPQITVNAQGSYQSDVTSLPVKLPNLSVPVPPKDQYRMMAEVSQLIYDGGALKAQNEIILANAAVQKQANEVTLYALRERVTQLYFAVLMCDAQLAQRKILRNNLDAALAKAEAAYKNGVSFRSNVLELKAEIIAAESADAEIIADRQAATQMLSILTGRQIEKGTIFEPPVVTDTQKGTRPEAKLFEFQKKLINAQEKKLKSDWMPKLSAFGQVGFGNPALNMLKDKFEPYGIVGLRINFPLTTLYTLKNNKEIFRLSIKQVERDAETFAFNNNIQIAKEDTDIEKFRLLADKDKEIIQLRSDVVASAKAQLDNGVITVSDYVAKLNAESLARQMKKIHDLMKLKAQVNRQNLMGY